MIRCCTLLLLHCLFCCGYKILVYSPTYAYSHLKFMGVIADTLTEAGHDVTVLMPTMQVQDDGRTGLISTKKIIKIPRDSRVEEFMKWEGEMVAKTWVVEQLSTEFIQMAKNVTSSFKYMCEGLIINARLLNRLRAERFDVGIAEAFGVCGLGIFEIIQVPATIATFSGTNAECISRAIGEPVIPSYVPGMTSATTDQMSFVGRLVNTVNVVLGQLFFCGIYNSEIESFRKIFGPQFKGYEELLSDASFIMTNSNPYLDYVRPMLQKNIPIGGITVTLAPNKNKLSQDWDSVLSKRSSNVLVSFGSVAKGIYIPEKYRQNLMRVFGSMRNTTFILKYEDSNIKTAEHPPNVYFSKWIPQNALLADPRLSVFVSHGGLGSTTEAAYHGKPCIVIPLFADQPRNAQMLARHGGALVLTKFDLEDPHKLRDALYIISHNVSYSQNARRLSEILLEKPIGPKQLLVRHVEFAARFGRLPNLDPYGRKLLFINYYLIDVIVIISCTVIVIVYFSSMITKKCISTIRKYTVLSLKNKKE